MDGARLFGAWEHCIIGGVDVGDLAMRGAWWCVGCLQVRLML